MARRRVSLPFEVQLEFAAQQAEQPEEVVARDWIFLPPWREQRNGKLGGWYGPTLHGYEQQLKDYRDSIYGGGLWDPAEPCGGGRVSDGRDRDRYDYDKVSAWMAEHSASLTSRQLEVFTLFWQRRMSYRDIASYLGAEERHIRKAVHRIRKRVG